MDIFGLIFFKSHANGLKMRYRGSDSEMDSSLPLVCECGVQVRGFGVCAGEDLAESQSSRVIIGLRGPAGALAELQGPLGYNVRDFCGFKKRI